MSVALSFIPTGNAKLASAGKLQRYSIVFPPSESGGQRGFMTVGSTSPLPEPGEWSRHGGAEAQRHSARGRHPDSHCWGLAPLSGESNGTSFSSKACLSFADLEGEKSFLCYLLRGGRRWGEQADSNAFTRVDGGRSSRKAHYGGRFLILCLAQRLCARVDVQQCWGQSLC